MEKTLILVPARLAATRLPGKPLADIHGQPMIVHVWRRAIESGAGDVIVATDSLEIVHAIEAQGGQAVMTRSDHASGSDRIFEALQKIDPKGSIERVINLQGDLPTLDPHLVRSCLSALDDSAVDIATLGVQISEEAERDDPNVVKIVGTPSGSHRLRALYFTRSRAPWGEGPHYHHVGIYAYRRSALARFVGLAPSPLERREKLEQLRALENGMRIEATLVDTLPLGVDTPADLERARRLLA